MKNYPENLCHAAVSFSRSVQPTKANFIEDSTKIPLCCLEEIWPILFGVNINLIYNSVSDNLPERIILLFWKSGSAKVS